LAGGTKGVALKPGTTNKQGGFTLLETMVSVIILAVGLISVLALFGYSVSTMQTSQEDLIARTKAKEALESVFSARNSAQITFNQLQNKANGGIFLDGFAQIYDPPGADGIANTDDDSNSANSQLDAVVLPGPDGVLGTADDVRMTLSSFRRQIAFSPVFDAGSKTPNPNLRLVTVTVQYTVPQFGARKYTVNAYISRFR
jgi:type II secretory pathway pseudopilin PulG